VTLAEPRDDGKVDAMAARRFFDRSAIRGDHVDTLTREVERRMVERLDYVRLKPLRILDAGTGGGHGLPQLGKHYPDAELIGIDSAHSLLMHARARRSFLVRAREWFPHRHPRLICGDFGALPLAARSFQLVWSNLSLAWASDPLVVFREFQRVLEVGGLAMFSTYGPDTLKELREAFSVADNLPHTQRFQDMHDVGDMLVAAGFSDPVMDMETITLTYSDMDDLIADLRLTGQMNAACQRRRGLMGRAAYQAVRQAYEGFRLQGRLPATVEIVYGHAWKAEPRVTREGHDIIRMDFGRKT
jgi:malonyl-CoA O-methyltransferase